MVGVRSLLLLLASLLLLQAQEDGVKALEAGKYEDAVRILSKQVTADPEDLAAHFHLGLAYSFLNQDAKAEAEFERVLALQPGLFEAQLNLGQIQLRQNKFNEAQKVLLEAVGKKPDHARAHYLLAEAHAALKDTRANEHYKRALDLDPKLSGARFSLGLLYLDRGELGLAQPLLEQAASEDPVYRPGLLRLAQALEAKGEIEKALTIYERSGDVGARERAANLRLKAGKTEDAVAALEKVVAESPTAANRFALAIGYLRSKQLDKAELQLGEALKLEPQNSELRAAYARTLRDQRKFDPALVEFRRLVLADASKAEYWSEIAGLLVIQQRFAEAIAALEKVQQLGAEKPGHVYLKALSLDRLDQNKAALAAYQEFLAASKGVNPDEEFKARQRIKVLEKEIRK